eukprot:7470865-Pyramimonas_sp.AAC.1
MAFVKGLRSPSSAAPSCELAMVIAGASDSSGGPAGGARARGTALITSPLIVPTYRPHPSPRVLLSSRHRRRRHRRPRRRRHRRRHFRLCQHWSYVVGGRAGMGTPCLTRSS